MLNAVNPGEPVNPIVVVEDGGIYRIVDGERRYKAMRRNKLARCHAVVSTTRTRPTRWWPWWRPTTSGG